MKRAVLLLPVLLVAACGSSGGTAGGVDSGARTVDRDVCHDSSAKIASVSKTLGDAGKGSATESDAAAAFKTLQDGLNGQMSRATDAGLKAAVGEVADSTGAARVEILGGHLSDATTERVVAAFKQLTTACAALT